MYGDPRLLVLNEYPKAWISHVKSFDSNSVPTEDWIVHSETNNGVALGSSEISEEDAWRRAAEYVGE